MDGEITYFCLPQIIADRYPDKPAPADRPVYLSIASLTVFYAVVFSDGRLAIHQNPLVNEIPPVIVPFITYSVIVFAYIQDLTSSCWHFVARKLKSMGPTQGRMIDRLIFNGYVRQENLQIKSQAEPKSLP